MYMRRFVYIFVLSVILPPLTEAQTVVDARKGREPSKLHQELAPRPYTFDRYMADLKDSARKDAPKPANPVTEEETKVAANKYKTYKPLAPFVVEW
jgi:hypothetical protein